MLINRTQTLGSDASLFPFVKMVGSIRFLRFVQKFHQTIGICPPQPNQKPRQFNSMNTIFLTCFAQFMFTTVAFLVFDTKSMFDVGFGFFMLICMVNAIVIYLIFIWQAENSLKFIANCEGFIKKSKYCYRCKAFLRL